MLVRSCLVRRLFWEYNYFTIYLLPKVELYFTAYQTASVGEIVSTDLRSNLGRVKYGGQRLQWVTGIIFLGAMERGIERIERSVCQLGSNAELL